MSFNLPRDSFVLPPISCKKIENPSKPLINTRSVAELARKIPYCDAISTSYCFPI